MSNVREEIVRVKHLVYCSSEPVIQTGAIDTLAAYGEQAVDAITEVISLSNISDQVMEHGLRTIDYIKKIRNNSILVPSLGAY